MELTRFERKILLAIGAVAVVPLVAALFLGRAALGEAYRVGVNNRVHAQLEQALDIYRRHLATLREDAERTADAVSGSHELRVAVDAGAEPQLRSYLEGVLERYGNVAAVVVRAGDGEVLAQVERAERLDRDRMRLLTRSRELGEGTRAVADVTIATPVQPFREYQRAGEVEEVYSRLKASGGYVSNYYLFVYIAFLVSVIVVALAVGFVLSRRVTRRVAELAEATERVGAGDLSVEIPTDARDEVGELTRDFNAMVRDLRESRERIAYLQRIGAWQEFARRLAHEIKNPLTPIQLASQEMLRSYTGDDERYRRKLEDACSIVEEEVATLRRLVGEFSAFAKLPHAELASSDLGDFVQEVERSIAGILEDMGAGDALEVRCAADRAPLPVRIDTMMLKRCTDNLLRNAIQAVRGAGIESGLVWLEAKRSEPNALLEIRDNGPGIDPADRDRVFDPYFTTKVEGTGLGLAIVKKVVLEHGGRIECDAAPEGGATFRIVLPLDEPAADAMRSRDRMGKVRRRERASRPSPAPEVQPDERPKYRS
jgi:nitrogen fixation/metabolism regulation signal transduction histidine kinase